MRSTKTRLLRLPEDAVHVWSASLDVEATRLGALARQLSRDEVDRARRLRSSRDRARFVVARGILRELVGRYLGVEPRRVRFHYGARGKPRLDEDALAINVSHAGDRACFAFARGREIGVDFEQVRHDFPCERVAAAFFSVAEVAALRAFPPRERCDAFFRCWTRKEAYLKARGDGLAVDLDSFDVSLDECAELLREPDEPGRFALYSLNAPRGHAMALAVEGARPCVSQRWWT
jgi:4'-phosphopantetheinyl transferase